MHDPCDPGDYVPKHDFGVKATISYIQAKVQAAYLDSRRTIAATLSRALVLMGTETEDFTVTPPLQIAAVRDNRRRNLPRNGYEPINGGTQVRFVLAPGQLGFPATAADGTAAVYVSGPFNGWSNTQHGNFQGAAPWRMKWHPAATRYELVAAAGTGPGQVPPSGAEFKFTWDRGGSQEWYPASNVPIVITEGEGTREVIITLAEDADVTRDYFLGHELFQGAWVRKRGVLGDPAFVYDGDDLGHTYKASGTGFRLWAPAASGVDVLLYEAPEGGLPQIYPLTADRGGTWVVEVPGDLKGKYYTFRLTNDSCSLEIMDPYAIGAGVNGNRALVVDLSETNPPGWESTVRPPFQSPTDAIIYEIHMRDLSMHSNSGIKHKGKFLGFTELGTVGPDGVKTGLEHLKELGVTHVQLMPSFDFASVDERRPGQYNWGYDPKNFNLPEGSYATDPDGTARIKEFKRMVQALHQNGIRVVMDVVYNHTYVGASPFESIAPHCYYRFHPDGRPSNGSGTGNETASEQPMVRKFIVDSVRFWAREYKVDGFRFDLMALHDVETMKQVRAALNEIDPSILICGEPWTGGASPLEHSLRLQKGNQKGLGIGVFNDNFRNAIKGDNDGTHKGFATGAGMLTTSIQRGVAGSIQYDRWLSDFALHPSESINYVSAHDNLTLWDKIARSNPHDTEADRIRMDLLAQAIVFTSQGVVFLHGGEEMLRTKGGHHNSYRAPDVVNQLDWSRKARYEAAFRYYQGLAQLRRAHPAFRMSTAEQVKRHLTFLEGLAPNTVAFLLDDHAGGDPWRRIMVVYNPNREAVEIPVPVGAWSVAAKDLHVGGITEVVSRRVTVPRISMVVLFQTE